MTASLRQAAQIALNAWQTSCYGDDRHHKEMLLAMTSLRAALAVPDEPVERQPLTSLDAQQAFNAWNFLGDSVVTDAFYRLKTGDKIERAFLDGLRAGEAAHGIRGAA
ncbi:MAG: hypothetical protein JWR74_3202 [Polaromonas sp.]|nr:hypothetical protein [Polaromonas sp.]